MTQPYSVHWIASCQGTVTALMEGAHEETATSCGQTYMSPRAGDNTQTYVLRSTWSVHSDTKLIYMAQGF